MMKGARTAEISFHTKRRQGLKYHSDVCTANKKICNDCFHVPNTNCVRRVCSLTKVKQTAFLKKFEHSCLH